MKFFVLFIVMVVLNMNLTVAQSTKTGKIKGTVIDVQTNKPIAGATVMIENIRLGASTDAKGEYYILQVPPGAYTIKCLVIGYTTITQENILISSDTTTTVDFKMSTKIAGSEDITINAKKPIVQKDKTSSETTFDSSKISDKTKTEKNSTTTKPRDTDHVTSDSSHDSSSPTTHTTPIVDTSRVPKAGEHDDNEEFPAFLDFFNRFSSLSTDLNPIKEDIAGRIIVSVVDVKGNPIKGALLTVNAKHFRTANDGEIILFPSDIGLRKKKNLKAFVTVGDMTKDFIITSETAVRQEVRFDTVRQELQKVPVDIVFTLDTTGSMGDEIDILRDTIYSIYTRIKKLDNTNIDLRFGVVLYRDKGDIYLTKQFALTSDITAFQDFLFNVRAGGGGDTPEDLIAGLDETVNRMNWRDDAIKLSFIVTDAPGHMYDVEQFRSILTSARKSNIKIYAIGASGLDTIGEIQLRITAQNTKASFIFLTYGETGESSGRDDGKVSHHTGTNFTSRNLDDIVVDNVSRQIRFLVPASSLTALHQNYNFKAEEERITLRTENAFQQIIRQLHSKINQKTSILVLEPDSDSPTLKEMSIFVQSYLEKTIVEKNELTLVDRSKLGKVLEEIQLKLMGLTEGEDFSKLAHAKTILTARLYYIGDSKVLFLRLISTDTSEVLAASMVRI